MAPADDHLIPMLANGVQISVNKNQKKKKSEDTVLSTINRKRKSFAYCTRAGNFSHRGNCRTKYVDQTVRAFERNKRLPVDHCMTKKIQKWMSKARKCNCRATCVDRKVPPLAYISCRQWDPPTTILLRSHASCKDNCPSKYLDRLPLLFGCNAVQLFDRRRTIVVQGRIVRRD